jgi:hypothetical protein
MKVCLSLRLIYIATGPGLWYGYILLPLRLARAQTIFNIFTLALKYDRYIKVDINDELGIVYSM